MGPAVPPTVFVSYSWDDEEHQSWVTSLAADLTARGVEVTLDRWDLRVGDDVTTFMERVTDTDYVVLVCTERYAQKADSRSGGVGWEYTVLTGDLVSGDDGRPSIVPILRQGTPSNALPRYLKTRLFIDFRDGASYEAALEQLLRHVFNAPAGRPALGPAPSFDEPVRVTGDASPPAAWILVAGIGRASDFSDQHRVTAENLGRLIAEMGFGLVTGGWPGVDEAVARSFAAEVGRRRLPLEDLLVQVIPEHQLPSFPAGDLILVRRGSDEWLSAIARSDVVVLIGGAGGTWTTGKLALREGRIVLPLADTGGDAKKMYMHMLKHWDSLNMGSITRRDFQTLGRSAPDVVSQIEALLKVAGE
jgi:predicted Rossmann-fold nucleotide-binding protein